MEKSKEIKVIVKKEFLDRHSGKLHKVGDEIKVSAARLREIKNAGDYIEIPATAVKVKE